jgi:DNA-binding NarL/FixJ family response regulator
MATRLLIVDDHEVVRAGLESSLSTDPRFEVVGTAGSGREALERARQTLPDIALVDLRLPDTRGDDLTREIRRRLPSTAVIILTSYLEEGVVRAALEAGASGYVTKSAGLAELIATIEMVSRGDSPLEAVPAPQIVKQLHKLVSDRADDLTPTPRQESVLELAAQGLTNSEIGEKLFISESTVRFHVQKLKEKFSARTKTELIAKAIRAGFIAPALEDGVPPAEL